MKPGSKLTLSVAAIALLAVAALWMVPRLLPGALGFAVAVLIGAAAIVLIGIVSTRWPAVDPPRILRRPELAELDAMIKTPEVSRPYVFCCLGCALHFRSEEEHDFGRCRALAIARGEDGGAA